MSDTALTQEESKKLQLKAANFVYKLDDELWNQREMLFPASFFSHAHQSIDELNQSRKKIIDSIHQSLIKSLVYHIQQQAFTENARNYVRGRILKTNILKIDGFDASHLQARFFIENARSCKTLQFPQSQT